MTATSYTWLVPLPRFARPRLHQAVVSRAGSGGDNRQCVLYFITQLCERNWLRLKHVQRGTYVITEAVEEMMREKP